MKGVLNQSVDGSKLIMKRCGVCSCGSYDAKFNETSKGILRCTVRELTKRLRDKHAKRDREPSVVPVKILIRKMRKRLNRQKLKKTNLRCIIYYRIIHCVIRIMFTEKIVFSLNI